ncbi:MAG: sterol desaturase family protein [Ilumatobacteraceae bacterium]
MSPEAFVLTMIVAFVAMEPLTAATHRWVMHGIGSWFHRSHHRSDRGPSWERNDWYPVMFAGIVMVGLWFGFHRDSLAWLIPVGIGITLYGAAYAAVHDGYIHRRLDPFGGHRLRALDHLAEAHRIHHLFNGAPFGMLAPIVPAHLRERASRTERNPLSPRPQRITAGSARSPHRVVD